MNECPCYELAVFTADPRESRGDKTLSGTTAGGYALPLPRLSVWFKSKIKKSSYALSLNVDSGDGGSGGGVGVFCHETLFLTLMLNSIALRCKFCLFCL